MNLFGIELGLPYDYPKATAIAVAYASEAIVPDSSGTVNVLVELLEIPEHSNANCLVLSELSLNLNPLSSVTTALDVIEEIPVKVVALDPKVIAVLPTVTALFASCELGIELVPISPEL